MRRDNQRPIACDVRAIGAARLGLLSAAVLAVPLSDCARGLTIVPTYAASISALPPATQTNWKNGISAAIGQLEALITNPITVNITFAGNPGTSIFGQSNFFLTGPYTYGEVQ